MKKLILSLGSMFCMILAFAQSPDPITPYVVTSDDDTVYCSAIKLKQLSVTCQAAAEKKEWRNEFVRKIYLPVAESDWEQYFTTYSLQGSKQVYLQTPEVTAAVIRERVYPRFFDMRPLDEEKDFWTRGLFEILAVNNGYKLCRLKEVKSATPSFASSGSDPVNKFILFKDFEPTGVTLDKNNCREELAKLAEGCAEAQQVLNVGETNFVKDMQAFLVPLASCK